MKNVLLAGAAVLALASGAEAADLGVPRGPVEAVVVSPAFSWTGFYLGGHLGYGWGQTNGTLNSSTGIFESNEPSSPRGIFGGGQIGYNWQFNNFVLGLETDLSAAGLKASAPTQLNPFSYQTTTRINWFGTTRLRAGLAVDRALLYVTGGLAYGGVRVGVEPGAPGFGTNGAVTSRTRVGYALGAGVEYAITPNWTVKAEYLYANLGSSNYVVSNANEFIRATPQIHTVRLGVNYLFSTGPSAVVARY